ncbi:MAG: quinone oxidoreductase [Holophagaceae bacterium]|nr:quinone oxidoreductase [Holophagaceae bacterium]
MQALCFREFGGPGVLHMEDLPDPVPERGHALVRMKAIGLNFADIYRRKGNYHLAGSPPWIAGYEGAGVIEAMNGDAPSGTKIGNRVAFADAPFANSELVAVPFEKIIPLPDDISFETATGLLLQGLTAQYLARDSHRIETGEDVLIHAAAGGVGLLLIQIAKRAGARVLGLVSSEPKRQAALEAGADEVVLYSDVWVQAAQHFSVSGTGMDVVYDSVGSTLGQSLDALRRGGHAVFFGMAGGDPQPVDPRYFMDASKTLTGGDLWNVLTTHEERTRRANGLFEWVRSGALKLRIAASFPLSEGSAAHAFLESRSAIGKVLLIP